MNINELLADGYSRIHRSVHTTLEGLTAEQLTYRPALEANTIAWLVWHLTRVQDHHLSSLAGRDQAWIEAGWHDKFGKPADPDETGQRYTADQVAGIRPAGSQPLLDYYDAVHSRSLEYIKGLSAADLDRVLDEPQWNPKPTVGVRLVSVIGDNMQHAGQASYLRGLIENRHWFPA